MGRGPKLSHAERAEAKPGTPQLHKGNGLTMMRNVRMQCAAGTLTRGQ